jgi:hypothetical protein
MRRSLTLNLLTAILLTSCQAKHLTDDNLAAADLASSPTTSIRYVPGSSRKICQLTGDFDRERNEPTLNQTYHNYGVSGTDLGSSFVHEGRTYFLFGDTVGFSFLTASGADSVAYTTDTNPEECLHLQFVTSKSGQYRPPRVPGVSLGPYEVPTGGFSANGNMYVFFTTDHTFAKTMGRSLLARSTDHAQNFSHIYDFSREKFINVAPVVVENSAIPGLPEQSGRGVLLWGSGMYRKSDPYLAFLPLDKTEDRNSILFFAGLNADGTTRWSAAEADASPLFHQACLGELSVAWNPYLHKWIMLYNCKSPRGINFRVADAPWGPWSSPQVLFNARRDGGHCRFIHASWFSRWCDTVNDFGRGFTWGGAYGPYMIPAFFTGNDKTSTIYYLLSTWNPYQVLLMKSTLMIGE